MNNFKIDEIYEVDIKTLFIFEKMCDELNLNENKELIELVNNNESLYFNYNKSEMIGDFPDNFDFVHINHDFNNLDEIYNFVENNIESDGPLSLEDIFYYCYDGNLEIRGGLENFLNKWIFVHSKDGKNNYNVLKEKNGFKFCTMGNNASNEIKSLQTKGVLFLNKDKSMEIYDDGDIRYCVCDDDFNVLIYSTSKRKVLLFFYGLIDNESETLEIINKVNNNRYFVRALAKDPSGKMRYAIFDKEERSFGSTSLDKDWLFFLCKYYNDFGKENYKFGLREEYEKINGIVNERENKNQDERNTSEYRRFRQTVLRRAGGKCELTHVPSNVLVVHHLNGFNWFKMGRCDPDNAIAILKEIHMRFHKLYGYGDNTKNQWLEFVYCYYN